MSPLLTVQDLRKDYYVGHGLFRKSRAISAVDGVSFGLNRGEVVGLVGESGSGKTTVGRAILRLIEPTSGTVTFDGTDVTKANGPTLRALRRQMQIISVPTSCPRRSRAALAALNNRSELFNPADMIDHPSRRLHQH